METSSPGRGVLYKKMESRAEHVMSVGRRCNAVLELSYANAKCGSQRPSAGEGHELILSWDKPKGSDDDAAHT